MIRNKLEKILSQKVFTNVTGNGEPTFIPSYKYKCPVCSSMHENDNLVLNYKLQLDCFSNR